MKPGDEARRFLEELIQQQLKNPRKALPSEREIARETGLSRATVNRVCRQLCEKGRLVRHGHRLYLGSNAMISGGALPLAIVNGKRLRDMVQRCPFPLDIELIQDPARYQTRIYEAAAEERPGILTWPVPPLPEVLEFVRLKEVPLVTIGQDCPNQDNVEVDWAAVTLNLLDHLHQVGHEKILLAAVSCRTIGDNILNEVFEKAALERGIQPWIWTSTNEAFRQNPEDFSSSLRQTLQSPEAPTAAILTEKALLTAALEISRELNLDVPQDLALTCLFVKGLRDPLSQRVPCVADHDESLLRVAAGLLTQRMMERATLFKRPGPIVTLKVDPEISHLDQLTGPKKSEGTGSPISKAAPRAIQRTNNYMPRLQHSLGIRWLKDPVSQRQAKLRQFNNQPYPEAGRGEHFMVDLSEHLNRATHPYRQWFGKEPLLHLKAGRLIAHAIPFKLGAHPKNAQVPTLILLASSALTHRKGHELPDQVTIPLERSARAIYFLHACGYSQNGCHFADYIIRNAASQEFRIPLVSGGMQPTSQSNIQDWWVSYPHVRTPHCRPYCIAENDDSCLYERYLYTLEWINPKPETPLRHIQVQSAAECAPALALLAVTLIF